LSGVTLGTEVGNDVWCISCNKKIIPYHYYPKEGSFNRGVIPQYPRVFLHNIGANRNKEIKLEVKRENEMGDYQSVNNVIEKITLSKETKVYPLKQRRMSGFHNIKKKIDLIL
jgi:hypothetical protein